MKDCEFENQPTPNSPQAKLMSCTVCGAKQSHTAKEKCNNEKGSFSCLNPRAFRHIVLQYIQHVFLKTFHQMFFFLATD